MRERRVLRQVVAPEDAPLPHVPPDSVRLPFGHEVALEELTRHVLQRLEPVEPRARRRERVLVDVGAVDLDVVVVLRPAQTFGDQHREGVRLLARRAARAPQAQAVRRGRLLDQHGEDAFANEPPGLRVAEEAGDVDQDDVQELGVLVPVAVEVADVGLEIGDADLVHPAAHLPEERALPVLSEVEVVLEVQLVEELAEAGVPSLRAALRAGLVVVLDVGRVRALAHRMLSGAAVPLARTSRTIAAPTSSSRSLKSMHPVA